MNCLFVINPEEEGYFKEYMRRYDGTWPQHDEFTAEFFYCTYEALKTIQGGWELNIAFIVFWYPNKVTKAFDQHIYLNSFVVTKSYTRIRKKVKCRALFFPDGVERAMQLKVLLRLFLNKQVPMYCLTSVGFYGHKRYSVELYLADEEALQGMVGKEVTLVQWLPSSLAETFENYLRLRKGIPRNQQSKFIACESDIELPNCVAVYREEGTETYWHYE